MQVRASSAIFTESLVSVCDRVALDGLVWIVEAETAMSTTPGIRRRPRPATRRSFLAMKLIEAKNSKGQANHSGKAGNHWE